jgi:hypothetical protein
VTLIRVNQKYLSQRRGGAAEERKSTRTMIAALSVRAMNYLGRIK